MPWISVLPGATTRGTISVAGPSLMNPRCAKVISHSVVRAPRAASSPSIGRGDAGREAEARVGDRLVGPDGRARLGVQHLAGLRERDPPREGHAAGPPPPAVVDHRADVAAVVVVVLRHQAADAAGAGVDVEPDRHGVAAHHEHAMAPAVEAPRPEQGRQPGPRHERPHVQHRVQQPLLARDRRPAVGGHRLVGGRREVGVGARDEAAPAGDHLADAAVRAEARAHGVGPEAAAARRS